MSGIIRAVTQGVLTADGIKPITELHHLLHGRKLGVAMLERARELAMEENLSEREVEVRVNVWSDLVSEMEKEYSYMMAFNELLTVAKLARPRSKIDYQAAVHQWEARIFERLLDSYASEGFMSAVVLLLHTQKDSHLRYTVSDEIFYHAEELPAKKLLMKTHDGEQNGYQRALFAIERVYAMAQSSGEKPTPSEEEFIERSPDVWNKVFMAYEVNDPEAVDARRIAAERVTICFNLPDPLATVAQQKLIVPPTLSPTGRKAPEAPKGTVLAPT